MDWVRLFTYKTTISSISFIYSVTLSSFSIHNMSTTALDSWPLLFSRNNCHYLGNNYTTTGEVIYIVRCAMLECSYSEPHVSSFVQCSFSSSFKTFFVSRKFWIFPIQLLPESLKILIYRFLSIPFLCLSER